MIWPFNKSNPASPADEAKPFREFRAIGETFNYLGRECIVTGYWSGNPFGPSAPMLFADYADKRGEIHDIAFTLSEIDGLRRQNPQIGDGTK